MINIDALTRKTALKLNLLSNLNGRPRNLYKAASHLIKNGGKRIRPYLVLKCCEILDGNETYAIHAANAIEMIHNFTLVHDDIIDNDETRHGVDTVHKKFNPQIAILAGDILFSKAYQLISDNLPDHISKKIISTLARACIQLCEGQYEDIQMANSKIIPSEISYIQMIEKKTASLFEISCSIGAMCAQKKKSDIINFAKFGINLGIAFQIIDDLIGISGDPKITKKPVENDLREGKKSLPIIIAIHKSRGMQRKKIMEIFGNTNASKNELENVVNIIHGMEIENVVRKQALNYSLRAKNIINKYKDNSAKAELIDLLDFTVKRAL